MKERMTLDVKLKLMTDLFKNNNNKITYDLLKKVLGNERRARSAIFNARHKHGMVIEAIRDHGHDVAYYVLIKNDETKSAETPARQLAKVAQAQVVKPKPEPIVLNKEEELRAHAARRGAM